jgi:hypothetical protein
VTLPAADVDVPQVRVINIATDAEWRPVKRTNGFGNSHYESGHFRVAGGQDVRLYRAGGKRLVLLPAKGGGSSVLLQAADPDKLVSEIRSEWGR